MYWLKNIACQRKMRRTWPAFCCPVWMQHRRKEPRPWIVWIIHGWTKRMKCHREKMPIWAVILETVAARIEKMAKAAIKTTTTTTTTLPLQQQATTFQCHHLCHRPCHRRLFKLERRLPVLTIRCVHCGRIRHWSVVESWLGIYFILSIFPRFTFLLALGSRF